MAFRLYWYILRDLLKLLALSTAVLVTIISFGAAIKPLGDGELGPVALLKYIVLAMPPMLQFALPFSAAFSATIVYHRMASDNEINAGATSGVPYTQVLLPAATLGLVLTIGLSYLANFVSPRFWEAMERTARLDATEYLVRAVRRGEPVKAGKTLIYARDARRIDPPPNSEVSAAMLLEGLVVTQVEQGQVVFEATATQGVFHLTRRGHLTIITSALREPVLYDGRTRTLARAEGNQPGEYAIPDTFRDTPKFMDVGRLKAVAAAPQTYWRVAERIDDLRRWLIARRLYEAIDGSLRREGRAEFLAPAISELGGEPAVRRFILLGSGLAGQTGTDWRVAPPVRSDADTPTTSPGSPVAPCSIIRYEQGRAVVEYHAPSVVIQPAVRILLEEPSITIALDQAVQTNLTIRNTPRTLHSRVNLSGLSLPIEIVRPIRDLSAPALAKKAKEYDTSGNALGPLTRAIDAEIGRLHSQVVSRLVERAALAVSCLVMMLLGAIMAIHFRAALPLTVYLWSFIPAIVGLLLIGAGTDLIQSPDVKDSLGLAVMWSGNLAMSVISLIVLRRVMRN